LTGRRPVLPPHRQTFLKGLALQSPDLP
jgi:hypothetical protein